MTQFGANFTPVFIQQNGSRSAPSPASLSPTPGHRPFDTARPRHLQEPYRTFGNPNALESVPATSGTYRGVGRLHAACRRLRPAGAITQGALEA
jgi:hypothetical protein